MYLTVPTQVIQAKQQPPCLVRQQKTVLYRAFRLGLAPCSRPAPLCLARLRFLTDLFPPVDMGCHQTNYSLRLGFISWHRCTDRSLLVFSSVDRSFSYTCIH